MNERLLSHQRLRTLMYVGLTLMLAGYFLTWLPGPAAGLKIIGIELGEWIKFLGVGSSRDLFYLPPIAIGLLLALMTADWPNNRWQTWVMRGLAIAVSLLAFPAFAAITTEPQSEWLMRVILIGLVLLTVVISSLAFRSPRILALIHPVMVMIALVGAFLPVWQYLMIRPAVVDIMNRSIGFGPGLWANLFGGILVAISIAQGMWMERRRQKKAADLYNTAA
jgi:chromate transport protein ChrA